MALTYFNDNIPYSYSWFYHWYYSQIESYMDKGEQKDYYKNCKYLILWFNRVRGNDIFLIFYKDNMDLKKWIKYYGDVKLFLHYQYYKKISYIEGTDKESIIEIVLRTLMLIYKKGEISK